MVLGLSVITATNQDIVGQSAASGSVKKNQKIAAESGECKAVERQEQKPALPKRSCIRRLEWP